MSIDRTTDLGERRVFEGSEVDAALVKVALEREGVETEIQPTHTGRGHHRDSVYVVDASQLDQARAVVAGFVKGATASPAAIPSSWRCPKCGERIEGQFEACWQCGAARPSQSHE